MGSWGCGNFANDDALDFVAELKEYKSLDFVYNKIDQGLELANDYLDASVSSECLAAAELIAAFVDSGAIGLPDEITDWISNRKKRKLFSKPIKMDLTYLQFAKELVNLIIKKSELKDLWESASHDEYQNWIALQNQLIERLNKNQ